jgi:type II secretory pathway pseudopilin PulG
MSLETSMTQPLHDAADMRRVTSTHRDAGVSLVEILVSIVLIGMVVVAALLSLQTTIAGSGIDRDHANAFAWLQSASDAIYRAPHSSCTLTPTGVASAYEAVARDEGQVPKPVIWQGNDDATIDVHTVEFLWRTSFDAPYVWSTAGCLESEGQYTQRITIEVTTPDGLVKTLQMVKDY